MISTRIISERKEGKKIVPKGIAKKYNVGIMSRISFSRAIEAMFDTETKVGDSILFRSSNRSGQYELRVTRRAHGLDITWGKAGTFYDPLDKAYGERLN